MGKGDHVALPHVSSQTQCIMGVYAVEEKGRAVQLFSVGATAVNLRSDGRQILRAVSSFCEGDTLRGLILSEAVISK